MMTDTIIVATGDDNEVEDEMEICIMKENV